MTRSFASSIWRTEPTGSRSSDHAERELRRGLAHTRRYLLSHHEPDEYHRCHRLSVDGRTVYVCARCSGVYPGILAGLALVGTGTAPATWPWLAVVGPAPALVDWAVTTLTDRRGSNRVRTATGALLGTGYGVAVVWVLTAWPLWLLIVATGYGGVAAVLLARARHDEVDSESTGEAQSQRA